MGQRKEIQQHEDILKKKARR